MISYYNNGQTVVMFTVDNWYSPKYEEKKTFERCAYMHDDIKTLSIYIKVPSVSTFWDIQMSNEILV